MIGDVLDLLKVRLNGYLASSGHPEPEGSTKDRVVLLNGEIAPSFKLNHLTTLLVNLEEEAAVRTANPHRRTLTGGKVLAVSPEIRLSLYVLFVARFKNYKQGLQCLSLVIRYFQSHRLLDRQVAPDLPEDIEKLVIELVTLPFSRQNEIWKALHAPYQPSALYKVGLVVFRDDEGIEPPEIRETTLKLRQPKREPNLEDETQ